MTTPKMCRIAIIIDDTKSFLRDAGKLLDLHFVSPSLDKEFSSITVTFGEHGLEPIEVHEDVPFARDGQLIEVAIDVDDAGATKQKFQALGHEPVVDNFLPVPQASEYLFGRDFHGLPLMVCKAGDNEAQMRADGPFRELDAAPAPKVGCVTLLVDSIDTVSADLEKIFGMTFVETDPAGFGEKAVVGTHRIKLIEKASKEMENHFEKPLMAIEFMFDNVETIRQKLEAGGYPVLYTRELKAGRKAYYFGQVFQGMPLGIYPTAADNEIIGN